MPGHFDNRMIEAVNAAIEKVTRAPNENGPGFVTQGEFYNIFKKHDFYDVADPENKLTDEQKAQVPLHAQYRYSQFANAIAEMIQYFFTNDDIGVLLQLDDIILKLDANCTMNRDSIDSVAKTVEIAGSTTPLPGSPNPALIVGNKVKQIKEALTGAAMGVNPFNPDIISPLFSSVGLPDVSLGVLGNLREPGFFSPDWDFLYNYEDIKSDKFYQTGTGGLKIGAGIDLREHNEINLKKIFGVITTETKTRVSGNLKGGVQGKDFEIIKEASNIEDLGIVTISRKAKPKSASNPNGVPAKYASDGGLDEPWKIRDFRLNESQIRASYYEFVQLKLWRVIKNPENWAHGHWGALTNNAMPDYIRTAVCSFIWSNGLALEPGKSEDAALISYLITTGLYYFIGWNYPVVLTAISEIDRAIVDGNLKGPVRKEDGTYDLSNALPPGIITVDGLPKDVNIAKRYWEWTADFIIRFTKNTAGEELGLAMRKRRVAEANLIYKGLGKPLMPFGADNISQVIPPYHLEEGLMERDFDKVLDVIYQPKNNAFFRYSNNGSAGGNPNLGTPEPIAKLKFSKASDKTALENITNGEGVINTIRHLLDKSFVKYATVTRTASLPIRQASAMYTNLNNGVVISYKPPGRSINRVYMDEKEKLGLGSNPKNGQRIPDSERSRVIGLMADKIEEIGPETVSRHCGDLNEIAVLDIAPSSVVFHKDVFKSNDQKTAKEVGHGHLINTFYKAGSASSGEEPLLSRFLFPHKYAVYALRTSTDDPAYHIEITPPKEFQTSPNDKLPDIAFSFKNENFKTSEGREVAFMNDAIKSRRENSEKNDILDG